MGIVYRKEIDGLRALAVLPVIFYHAGVPGFSGGYFGVDIFFVISGYLITSILLGELNKNKFSIVNFYERRARRILPALFFMLIVTTIAGFLLLSPSDLKDFGKGLLSVVAFSSNIFYYLDIDYFSTASEEILLLHTWSLAVEEQFYIFFPLLLLFFKRKNTTMIWTLWAIAISSFGLALISADVNPQANFYLLQTRAWELIAGALIAIHLVPAKGRPNPYKTILSLAGLLMILTATLLLPSGIPHPSYPTLLPVIGTVLVIAYSQNTPVSHLLSNRLLVGIGLISYPLYLWHQPIFAFVRIKSLGEPSELALAMAIVLTTIMAYVSYRYIETPFRARLKVPARKIWIYSAYGLTIFGAIGLSVYMTQGMPKRFASDAFDIAYQASPKRKQCHAGPGNIFTIEDSCILPTEVNTQPTIAVLGDSHGVELSYALGELLRTENKNVVQLTYTGCPPALSFNTHDQGCSKWLKNALAYVKTLDSLDSLLLVFRHTEYLKLAERYIKNSGHASSAVTYWDGFEALLKQLPDGLQLYILTPVPELPDHIRKIITPFSVFSSGINKSFSYPLADEIARAQNVDNALKNLAIRYKAVVIEPRQQFCIGDICKAIIDKKGLYFDHNHPSLFGASLIAQQVKIRLIHEQLNVRQSHTLLTTLEK